MESRARVRQAVSAEVGRVAPLLSELFGKVEADFTFRHDVVERGLRGFFEDPRRAAIFAAWQGERCVGLATGQMVYSSAVGGLSLLVEDVVVSPDNRGRGIGGDLLIALERWGIRHGARRLELRLDRSNHGARKFYLGRGWKNTSMEWMVRTPIAPTEA